VPRSLDDQESPPALPELAQGQGRNRRGAVLWLFVALWSLLCRCSCECDRIGESFIPCLHIYSLMKQILYIRWHARIDACSW
jgi:hypothetical protein